MYLNNVLEPAYTNAYNVGMAQAALYGIEQYNASITAGNVNATMQTSTSSSEEATAYAAPSLAAINDMYIVAAILHLVSAVQYYGIWLPAGFRWYSPIFFPDYLNVIAACIYLYTASLYPQTGDLFSAVTMKVHELEATAASLEFIAACSWALVWWCTYPRRAGRGWTSDDPDIWANILIIVPSIYYVVYNAQVIAHPEQYGTNYLYQQGDVLFFAGAFFYLIAGLRDDGCVGRRFYTWFLLEQRRGCTKAETKGKGVEDM